MLLLTGFTFGQEIDFKPYNKRLITPHISYWHEFLGTANLGLSSDFQETETNGNIKDGINYGFGAGYLFKFGHSYWDVNAGLGLSYELYPSMYHKYNALFETNLFHFKLAEVQFFLFNGFDFTVTQAIPFDFKEAHTSIYLGAVFYKGFELKYGIQSSLDWFEESIGYYFDDNFHFIKMSYHFKL